MIEHNFKNSKKEEQIDLFEEVQIKECKEPKFVVWGGGMEEPEIDDWRFYVDKPEHWAWIAHKISTQRHFLRDKAIFLRANLDFNKIPMYPMSGCSQDGKAQYDWTGTFGFEGGNHIVKNMNMKAYADREKVSLTFCSIFGGDWLAAINNVIFKDITLEGGTYTGVLFNSGTGVVSNKVTITGDINVINPTKYLGILISFPHENCQFKHNIIKASIKSKNKITLLGGITTNVGEGLKIYNNIVDLTLETPVDYYAGIITRLSNQNVAGVKIYNNIHASKKITANKIAGGIIGSAYKPLKADDHFISHNVNLSDLTAPYAGGIAGYTNSSIIMNYCINRGDINKDKPDNENRNSAGIICYHIGDLTMTNCVNDGEIGINAENESSAGLVNIVSDTNKVTLKNNMVFKGGNTAFLNNKQIIEYISENNLTLQEIHSNDVGVIAGFEKVENREVLITKLPSDYKVCESGVVILNRLKTANQ